MDNNTQKDSSGAGASGYNFNNFYCHPGFFADPDNEVMKQIFGSSENNFAQKDKNKDAPTRPPGFNKENP